MMITLQVIQGFTGDRSDPLPINIDTNADVARSAGHSAAHGYARSAAVIRPTHLSFHRPQISRWVNAAAPLVSIPVIRAAWAEEMGNCGIRGVIRVR